MYLWILERTELCHMYSIYIIENIPKMICPR